MQDIRYRGACFQGTGASERLMGEGLYCLAYACALERRRRDVYAGVDTFLVLRYCDGDLFDRRQFFFKKRLEPNFCIVNTGAACECVLQQVRRFAADSKIGLALMVAGGKEGRARRNVGRRSEAEISYASLFRSRQRDYDFRSGLRGFAIYALRRGYGYAEVNVLCLLYKPRGPRGQIRIVAILRKNRTNIKNYVLCADFAIQTLQVFESGGSGSRAEILRQRLGSYTSGLDLIARIFKLLFCSIQKPDRGSNGCRISSALQIDARGDGSNLKSETRRGGWDRPRPD